MKNKIKFCFHDVLQRTRLSDKQKEMLKKKRQFPLFREVLECFENRKDVDVVLYIQAEGAKRLKKIAKYINLYPEWKVECHGLRHVDFSNMSEEKMYKHLKVAKELIEEVFNQKVTKFMPPWKKYNKITEKVCKELEMEIEKDFCSIKKVKLEKLETYSRIDIHHLWSYDRKKLELVLEELDKRNNRMSFTKQKVSIILVSWAETEERLNLLKNTLTSLYNSTDVPYEFIVVDNGPQNQTEFLKTQKRIDKLISFGKNIGTGKAKNIGFEESTGDIVVFLDNDLEFRRGWLERSLNVLEKYSEKKIIVAPYFATHHLRLRYRTRYLIDDKLDDCFIFSRSGPACWVVKRETIEEVGKFLDNTIHGDNYCEKLRKNNYTHYILKTPMVLNAGFGKRSFDKDAVLRDGKWFYEGISHWDGIWRRNFNTSIRKHRLLHNELKKYLRGKILDLGCGVTSLYEDKNYDITGVDYSTSAISKMKEMYPIGNFIVCDAFTVDFRPSLFDTILLVSLIEHSLDFVPLLKKVKKFLRDFGTIVIVVPQEHYYRDHIHFIWDEYKIKTEIESVLGKIKYYKFNNEWIILYTKTMEEKINEKT